MVEFDMNPQQSSWSDRSYTFRPGLGAPTAKGGKAEYDTGKKDSIGKTWKEDASKGQRAKVFDSDGAWIGEWLGGQTRVLLRNTKRQRKTQWMAGKGDGFLVWDINGNGIIDDNTEIMSEYDKDGNAAFANGFEKLAHYFDKDKNGIIEGAETQRVDVLGRWRCDHRTGELQPLSKFGITQIMVPTNKNTLQGDYTKKDRDTLTLSGGQYQEPFQKCRTTQLIRLYRLYLRTRQVVSLYWAEKCNSNHTPNTTFGIQAKRNKSIKT